MKTQALTKKAIPQWTKRVVMETGGRDPLGLSTIAHIITDYLLTGIITTTDRARYYSFYCWALWHIANENNPRKFQEFVDALRKREAVFALASILNNANTSPVGVQATRPRLEKGIEQEIIDCDFRVLPSNSLGGFGQYYTGCLNNLGLTFRPEGGIDRITGDNAKALADTFHNVIKSTPYIKKRLYNETQIQLSDLSKSKQRISIDGIRESFACNEREKLIEIFFAFKKKGVGDRDLLRRFSLCQILHIVAEYEKIGFYANLEGLDGYLVYPVYYYDVLWPSEKKTAPYVFPEELGLCKSLWRQFCLQQYFTIALESLMYGVLETVGSESAGLLVKDIAPTLLQPDFYRVLKETTGKPCKKPYNLLNALGIDKVPNETESLKSQRKFSLLNPLSEEQIWESRQNTPQAITATAMLMLSILYGKWRGIRNDPGLAYLSRHAREELWAGSILTYFDEWFKKELSWLDALEAMIEHFILKQHNRIMYQKGRLDSCWLNMIEERVFKVQDHESRLRSSRHWNAVSILRDLNLLSISGDDDLSITPSGRKLLKKVLR